MKKRNGSRPWPCAPNTPAQTAAVLGVHPQVAQTYDASAREKLQKLFKNPHAAAVGKSAWDYAYLHACPKEVQLRVFEEMLALAGELQKPIVLHVRREAENYEPYEQTFSLLKHAWRPAPVKYPGVLHCFSARYEEAKQALDHGLLLGINGCFTYKKNEYIREAVKKAARTNWCWKQTARTFPRRANAARATTPPISR